MAKKRAYGEGTLSQRKNDGRWIGQLTVPNPNPKDFSPNPQDSKWKNTS